ncbi:hypothetical protein BJV74DRAFT_807758 [Russula compacta]|nr:hypothetical protein BJV74DRAFT_807758 [Russula compacta]
MGGRAFVSHAHLPNATFPRLSPVIYALIKASLLPRLTPLFQCVGVPHEAPEKQDHGDVDFIVACPRAVVRHEDIKIVLGASACIPSAQSDGRGTHNFALRLADVVTPQPTDAALISGETSEVYIQVDVNIRKDAQDWENVMTFHSYGDLGMIVGRLAASVGLHLGELGLKITSQALVPTYSSTFALAGFVTQHEAFEWVACSRFHVPGQVVDRASRAKSRVNRSMYQAFFQWSEARVVSPTKNDGQPQGVWEAEHKEAFTESVRGEALVFFGKREEYDALVQANERRIRLKAIWNGKKVGEWTGGNGRVVSRVMGLMRQTIGEEKIGQMTEEELKQHVLQAKETVELQLTEERQAREGQEDANDKL